MWFTHGNVNGVNFWLEAPAIKSGGVVKHLEFLKIASGKPALIVTRNAWLAPNGKKLCEDQRTLHFDTDGDARWIDFDISIKATDGPVTFGDTKEGLFGVRVAETLRRRQAWRANRKQRASGRRRGRLGETRRLGRLSRPHRRTYRGNRDSQSPWQFSLSHLLAREELWPVYGQSVRAPRVHRRQARPRRSDFAPGKTLVLRYRVLLHRGDEKVGKVAEAFAAYAKAK